MKQFFVGCAALSAAVAMTTLGACPGGGGPIQTLPNASDTGPGTDSTTTGTDTANNNNGTDTANNNGTDTANNNGPDIPAQPDVPTGNPDTAQPPPGDCNYAGFDQIEKSFGSPQTGVTVYQAATSAGTPTDVFSIAFYGGEFGGATSAGSYPLAGINYADCGNCVMVRKNCDGTSCEKTFYAEEGTLVIDEWVAGGSFKGHLEGVNAVEVTIDPQTYVSTPVPNGEKWCLDGLTFDTSVPDGPPTGETQPECVAAGNGNLVGNNVKNIQYTNCLGETVQLHDGCAGQTKALWLMATAGWCTACEATLDQIVTQHGGGMLTRDKIGSQSPGLDMLIILGENQNGVESSLDYCMAYAGKNNLDPAMVVLDHNTAGVQISLISPTGYAVEINGLAMTWSAVNPYLTADDQGQVASAYPWMAVLRSYNMEYIWSDYFDNTGLNAAINQALSGP